VVIEVVTEAVMRMLIVAIYNNSRITGSDCMFGVCPCVRVYECDDAS
jgi:hypothetical protein